MTIPDTSKAMTAERLDLFLNEIAREFSGGVARQLRDHIDSQAAEIAALKAELATVRKVFAPVFKNFGPEWEDGTGLEVVLSQPDDEDGEEGTGRCEFTLGQLRRALKGPTP